MAEYLIQDTTLAGLADSARIITGETKQLSPAEMKEQLVIAEQQIGAQANLLAQLSTILDGKVSGGSGGSVETVAITSNDKFPMVTLYYTDGNMTPQTADYVRNQAYTVAKGTIIYVQGGSPKFTGTTTLVFVEENFIVAAVTG